MLCAELLEEKKSYFVCVSVCVHVCVSVCIRALARACIYVCVFVCARARALMSVSYVSDCFPFCHKLFD